MSASVSGFVSFATITTTTNTTDTNNTNNTNNTTLLRYYVKYYYNSSTTNTLCLLVCRELSVCSLGFSTEIILCRERKNLFCLLVRRDWICRTTVSQLLLLLLLPMMIMIIIIITIITSLLRQIILLLVYYYSIRRTTVSQLPAASPCTRCACQTQGGQEQHERK